MIPLHGIASRHDLPLPFWTVLLGAAIVLLITFWVVGFAWRTPRYSRPEGRELPHLTRVVDARWFRILSWGIAGPVWLLTGAALFLGPDRIDNPAVGFIYVWLWVGIVPASLLLGGFYRRVNPARLLLRATRTEDRGSVLPAALALLVFLYLELVHPTGATLPVLRVAAVAVAIWVIGGALLAGKEWIGRADPFDVYARLVARISPWARSPRGLVTSCTPLSHLASWAAPAGLVWVSVVLLGGTLFDALSNTAWWVRLLQRNEDLSSALGILGLLGSVVLILVLFLLGCGPLAGRGRLLATADALSPGLVPLIVGYALSHYGTMLYLEGQRTAFRFSDPLGRGWNLFGGAEAAPDVSLFAFPTMIAVLQVALIVGGHVLGVLVTHDIALRRGASVRSQVPLLVVMIVFTVGGLVLMFGA